MKGNAHSDADAKKKEFVQSPLVVVGAEVIGTVGCVVRTVTVGAGVTVEVKTQGNEKCERRQSPNSSHKTTNSCIQLSGI